MKPILYFVAFLVLSAFSASARVGETLAEITVRYGEPKLAGKAKEPATSAQTYQKAGLGITVHFLNGVSVMEVYFKVGNDEITDAEQEAIREANGRGKPWDRKPTFSGPEWTLEGGSLLCSYASAEKIFAVVSADFFAKANEAKAKKEKANLSGF